MTTEDTVTVAVSLRHGWRLSPGEASESRLRVRSDTSFSSSLLQSSNFHLQGHLLTLSLDCSPIGSQVGSWWAGAYSSESKNSGFESWFEGLMSSPSPSIKWGE